MTTWNDEPEEKEPDEFIEMHERTEIYYRTYLSEFDEKVWPIFKHYGYPKSTALMMWSLDKLRCSVESIEEQIIDRAA